MIYAKPRLVLLTLALLLWAFTMPLSAKVYDYYPKNTLTLGSSFDPLFPDRAFPSCLSFQSI